MKSEEEKMRLRSYKEDGAASLSEGALGYYPSSSSTPRPMYSLFILCVLVFTWYTCAILTINSSKLIMNTVALPFTLSTCQFIFSSLISSAYTKFINVTSHKEKESIEKGDNNGMKRLILQISIGYTAGFILTNCAFSAGKTL